MSKRVNVQKLRQVLTSLFAHHGLSASDADIVTDILLETELCGISTHGLSMVPAHIKKLDAGYNRNAVWCIEHGTASFSVCDADNSIGMLSAYRCMNLAIEKARTSGLHMVFCHNCNTFSAAYYYANMAAEAGMIAIISSNAPTQMAPYGGKEKLLGTNPMAISVPTDKEAPFIFDMATSAVAKSKINDAFHSGEAKIPFGWATDIEGKPTDDPAEAVRGLLLPMAGPKGYGLSMAVDLISGLLSGASCSDKVGRFYSPDNRCMNVGQSFAVIDPRLVYGESFYQAADDYVKTIRSSMSATDCPVRIPGDRNRAKREEALKNGLLLSDRLISDLNALIEKDLSAENLI